MEKITYYVRRLYSVSQSIASSAPEGEEQMEQISMFRLFDRYLNTAVQLPQFTPMLFSRLGLRHVAMPTDIPSDQELAQKIDLDSARSLETELRYCALLQLQSAPVRTVNFSWIWEDNQTAPALMEATGTSRSGSAFEGRLSDVLKSIWHNALVGVEKFEGILIDSYNSAISAYCRLSKKGVLDSVGRRRLEFPSSNLLDKSQLQTVTNSYARVALNAFRAPLIYKGSAGFKRRESSYTDLSYSANRNQASHPVVLVYGRTGRLSAEETLIQIIRLFCANILLKSSFISRRVMSINFALLLFDVFPSGTAYKILASNALRENEINDESIQSAFYNMKGVLCDAVESDQGLDQSRLLKTMRTVMNGFISGEMAGKVANDPGILSSYLFQHALANQKEIPFMMSKISEQIVDACHIERLNLYWL